MKKKYSVYNDKFIIVDTLTVSKTAGQFALLKSTQERAIEMFLPIVSLKQRDHFFDTQFNSPAIITLN